MTLSILIASLESRVNERNSLQKSLDRQGNHINVQVIWDIDNKEATTGAKRQRLLEKAEGEYITFIDDDDAIPFYYVSEILNAIKTKPDCVATNGYISTNGHSEMRWFLAKDNPNTTERNGDELYYLRTTNHLSPVKRELALQAGFPDITFGEDAEYSRRLKPFLKTETIILKPMYYYKFNNKK